jgi:signal transduction histidine kinase
MDKGVRGNQVRKYSIFLHKIQDSPNLLFTPFYIKNYHPFKVLTARRQKMRDYQILLVNGDPQSLNAECRALENMDYLVTTAIDGEAAIEELNKKDFNLVIMDLTTVLEKAKEMNPETMAILMLTANCRLTPATHAFRFDADDYLFKPFELTELGIRVANCIKKLELKRRNSQSEPQELTLHEKILNMMKIMSHDIRGSLVSMSATLKLLSRGYYGKMDEDVAKSLKELLAKNIGLIGITEEYLGRTFSVNDDLEIQEEVLDLMQDIINPVLEEFSIELKDYRILMDNRWDSISTHRISVKGSKVWLKTVFRNLLKNAIKYGDKGGVIAFGFEDHDSYCRLNVFNSGRPIPEEYRDKLFSKFMRCGNNGNGGPNGMGLGLYLIKKIIQKQGGEIWYEAKEDGSNFVFTLPARV